MGPHAEPGAALDLAVLIINFNGCEDTRRALRSLRSISQFSVRPIVIDNGSEQNEAMLLEREFPEAVFRRLDVNVGFSRGINLASEIAFALEARYILLLNNDAWFEKADAVLPRLVSALSSDPALAAVGPLVLEDDDSGRVQSAGYRFSFWWPLPRAVRHHGSKPQDFTYLSGCCLLMLSATYAEFHGFDPDFFLYGEDVDFGLRVKRAGRSMALVPDVAVRHRRGASSQLLSRRYVYTALRGNLIVTIKHARWYQLPTATVSSIVITLGLIVVASLSGTKNAHQAAVKAWIDFAFGRWGGLDGHRLTPADRPQATAPVPRNP